MIIASTVLRLHKLSDLFLSFITTIIHFAVLRSIFTRLFEILPADKFEFNDEDDMTRTNYILGEVFQSVSKFGNKI